MHAESTAAKIPHWTERASRYRQALVKGLQRLINHVLRSPQWLTQYVTGLQANKVFGKEFREATRSRHGIEPWPPPVGGPDEVTRPKLRDMSTRNMIRELHLNGDTGVAFIKVGKLIEVHRLTRDGDHVTTQLLARQRADTNGFTQFDTFFKPGDPSSEVRDAQSWPPTGAHELGMFAFGDLATMSLPENRPQPPVRYQTQAAPEAGSSGNAAFRASQPVAVHTWDSIFLYANRLSPQEGADGRFPMEQIKVSGTYQKQETNGTYAQQSINFLVTPIMNGASPQQYKLRDAHGLNLEGTAFDLPKKLEQLYPDSQKLSDLTIQKVDPGANL